MSQDYEGLGWVQYDAAFRRQAALTQNKRWSTINATLFATNFSGQASRARRCELCFATSHSERECAQSGDPDLDLNTQLKNLELALITLARPTATRPVTDTTQVNRLTEEPCRKWNAMGCSYPRCCYLHMCSGCKGSHPLARCPIRGQTLEKPQGPSHATSHLSTSIYPLPYPICPLPTVPFPSVLICDKTTFHQHFNNMANYMLLAFLRLFLGSVGTTCWATNIINRRMAAIPVHGGPLEVGCLSPPWGSLAGVPLPGDNPSLMEGVGPGAEESPRSESEGLHRERPSGRSVPRPWLQVPCER